MSQSTVSEVLSAQHKLAPRQYLQRVINWNKETYSVVGATLISLSDFIDGNIKEIVEDVSKRRGYVVMKYLTICLSPYL
jgi:hypothetical protein